MNTSKETGYFYRAAQWGSVAQRKKISQARHSEFKVTSLAWSGLSDVSSCGTWSVSVYSAGENRKLSAAKTSKHWMSRHARRRRRRRSPTQPLQVVENIFISNCFNTLCSLSNIDLTWTEVYLDPVLAADGRKREKLNFCCMEGGGQPCAGMLRNAVLMWA